MYPRKHIWNHHLHILQYFINPNFPEIKGFPFLVFEALLGCTRASSRKILDQAYALRTFEGTMIISYKNSCNRSGTFVHHRPFEKNNLIFHMPVDKEKIGYQLRCFHARCNEFSIPAPCNVQTRGL